MPQRGNVHIDAALTNLAIQYRNLAFVAEYVLPPLPVMKESDKYYVFSREELREIDTHRAVGAASKEADWDVTNATYSCEEYALSKLLADRIVNNSDAPIRPRMTTVNKLMRWIKLGYEKRTKNLVTGGSLSHANPSPKWDATSGTIVIEKDVDGAKAAIRLNAGVEPNRILFNDQVKDVVKRDSTVRNLIRYTIQGSGGQELLINGDLPPVLWNLAVTIAGAAEDTSKRGQSASLSRIWPDDVLIWYAEPAPAIESLSLGYTFRVTNGIYVKTWREEKRGGEFIEPAIIQDEKLVATNAGYILDDVLT